MKPSGASINRLKSQSRETLEGIPSDSREEGEAEATRTKDNAGRKPRARRLISALESAAEELSRSVTIGEIPEEVDRVRKKLTRQGIDQPPPGSAGQIAVRAVGVRGRKQPERAPLGGLALEAEFASGEVVSGSTDALGYALLTAPETEKSVTYELRAIGPDGEVVARKRGRIAPGASPTVRLEIGFRTSLRPQFALGQQWNTELERTLSRLRELKARAEAEMELQVKGLEAAARRLEEAESEIPDAPDITDPFRGVIRVASQGDQPTENSD